MLGIGGLFGGVADAEVFDVRFGGDLVAFGGPFAEINQFAALGAEGAPPIFGCKWTLLAAGWAIDQHHFVVALAHIKSLSVRALIQPLTLGRGCRLARKARSEFRYC